jgi:hypothetical protein
MVSLLFIIKNILINLFFSVLYKNYKSQPLLSQYGFDVTKIKTKEDITLMICLMIIRDLQPISIVEDDGFCKLLHFFQPDYQLPWCDTITRRIEKIFFDEELHLIKNLEKALQIAAKTDGWASQQTQKLFAT